MKPTERQDLYDVLGKLFYAISASDRNIRQEEIDAFRLSMKSDWIPFDPQAAFIETAFNQMLDLKPDSKECLAELKSLKHTHPDLFSDDLTKTIWETATKISEAVAKKNKSELTILTQIHFILKN